MREEAEEKATALRDEKLVDAASTHGERLVPLGEGRSAGQQLTVENMGKLEREADNRTPRSDFQQRKQRRLSTGLEVNAGQETDGSDRGEMSMERPKMERRWVDSEKTVTGRE
jgi:hypothetical protein